MQDIVIEKPNKRDCRIESWDVAPSGLTLSIDERLKDPVGDTMWIRTGIKVRDTGIMSINVVGMASWLSATGARVIAHDFDHYDDSLNVLISIRNGVPSGDRTPALRVVINKRVAMLRPKIKAVETPERVLERRSGSNKRSTREARGGIIPAMPVEIPQHSDEEELDEEAELPRFRRSTPNRLRLNRRRRCRVCRENPARGASVPCLALATATLCVACFIDRHPQYVDSIVRMIVVDTLPNLEGMMSGGENNSEGETYASEASGNESLEGEPSEVGLPAICAVVPQLDDVRESDHPELELYAMVARPVTKAERLVNPKAMASLDKEWNKLENQIIWEVEKVMPWRVIAEEARASGEIVHVGRIFDICVEKLPRLTSFRVAGSARAVCCEYRPWDSRRVGSCSTNVCARSLSSGGFSPF